MSSLSTVNDVDYRLIYMQEQDFAQRVRDVYIAKQGVKKPPTFHSMLEEFIDIQAYLLIEHYPEEKFGDCTEAKLNELREGVKKEDPKAIEFVLRRFDLRFIEMFEEDLLKYLKHNQYAFFEQDPYDRSYKVIHNSSLQNVW